MITRIIRDEGAMNAVISSEEISKDEMFNRLKSAPNMTGLDLAKVVSCKQPYVFKPIKKFNYKIAAIDYGIKSNILRIFDSYKCQIKVFPAKTEKEEILDYNPDGIFLSNGPGDPSACIYAINTVKSLLGIKPIFGICLGHQLLGLALGAKTQKMNHGHHGANHPVLDLSTGKVEITSMNHGFAIDTGSLPECILETHVSLFDRSNCGIKHKYRDIFSVQYHPEASPGPHDGVHLFSKFFKMAINYKEYKKNGLQ